MDKDGDGHLTEAEMVEFFAKQFGAVTVEIRCAMKLAFTVADLNKNGTIEWNEFLLMNTPGAEMSVATMGPRLKELFE